MASLTDDDSSIEWIDCQSKKVEQINRPKRQTASQRFQAIMISSDESGDEEIPGTSSVKVPEATSMEKENIPSSSFPPVQNTHDFFGQYAYRNNSRKIQSTSLKNYCMNESNDTSVNGSSKPAIKRFFRWTNRDQSEASIASNSRKRPYTSPDKDDHKRRSIEYDQQNHGNAIGVSVIIPDAVEEIDPLCGLSGEDVGLPAPLVTKHHRLEIAGIKVDFPLNPYPAQKAVMNALIKGCTKEEHVLIESPTGSGKTLALLCGALAWQSHYAVDYEAKKAEYINKMASSAKLDDDMYQSEKTKNLANITDLPMKEVPKIYYGSRTHRQIAQVVKELGRTVYRDTKMTILSSREFSCIQKTARNKTELCHELLDPTKKLGCMYYNEMNRRNISTFSALSKMDLSMPFDVEDLVELGQQQGWCPYFTARSLMLEADLIFCPYNYLIDPEIRKALQIDINDAIIILDEAHNIEDICRDTASAKFDLSELESIDKECIELLKLKPSDVPKFVPTIRSFCSNFGSMIQELPLKKVEKQSDISYSTTWKGTEFLTVLDSHNIKENLIHGFVAAIKEAIEHHNDVKESMRDSMNPVMMPSFTSIATKSFEKFIFVFAVLRSHKSVQDFRIFVKESTEWRSRTEAMNTQFKRGGDRTREEVRTLEVHCMNPGVIFSPIADKARTVILASGTLSPIVSFASELEAKFKHILQTNHVIPKENVNIRVIAKGPKGTSLRATFQNTNNWLFLDELARIVADTCQSVPHGILCFVPSYSFLNKLTDRMRLTGIMDEVEKIKLVCTEPKTSRDLVDVMFKYRGTIKMCTEDPQGGGVTGAILFAVFRGKIAEGIDFSDGEARAVMIIGIPYAVYKDPVVQLKIQYNDEFKQKKELLKGYEWYTIQAYRALNQALGRCIRHINDWSSVLLVDERFSIASNRELLPKWVKTIWAAKIDTGPYSLMDQLKRFSIERTKADEVRKAEAL